MNSPVVAPTEAQWWHAEGDRLVCDLCPRECRLGEGQRGFCFVRKNEGGHMVLTTYGRSTGFCIDPIEKKPLNHFLPGTPVLSFGTAGCNLGCKFCQNWDISKSREVEILSQEASPEAIVKAARDSGCRSIAFTYNDPVIWAEYAIDTAKAARAANIKAVAVTAGYITPSAREAFFAPLDAANIDLKAFTDTFYRELAFAHLDPVLDTLSWLKRETDTWFEITTLLIPGQNDSPDEVARLSDWILENLGPDVPLHFSAFHPDFKMRDIPATPHQTLIEAREIAVERGLRYVYVGNVLDQMRQSTRCPGCGEVVIERDHYELGRYHLVDGACATCRTPIPGVFEDERGDWGRKRLPVKIEPVSSMPASGSSSEAMPETDDPFPPSVRQGLIAHARHLVESTVRGVVPSQPLPEALAEIPCHGLFVSLKRGHQLRGCIGNFHAEKTTPLGQLLERAAPSVAAQDRRFPSPTVAELPFLTIELTPLHAFRQISETGENRVRTIEVGRHGLVLGRGSQRGLLLPQVATEQGYDARAFLEQVSLKAGMEKEAWLDPETTLTLFEGDPFSAAPSPTEVDPASFSRRDLEVLASLTQARLDPDRWPVPNPLPDALVQTSPAALGLVLESGKRQAISIKTGASFRDLAVAAAASLQQQAAPGESLPLTRLHLLSLPLGLSPADYPTRHQLVARSAVLVQKGSKFAVSVPIEGVSRPSNPIVEALASLGHSPDDWNAHGLQLTAFQRHTVRLSPPPPSSSPLKTRPSAVAGKFYPGTAAEIDAALDSCFSRAAPPQGPPTPAPSVMLPHAGWPFCGDLIATTLAAVVVPEIVVVIGPKHTPHGANWSASEADSWALPGDSIPVAVRWVDFLVERCPGLVKESDAHRQEHGCEVLLPFLRRRNPDLAIVPLAIGAADFDALAPLAAALAALRKELGDRLLFVVSSDMNHFASEAENRRRDALALDRLKANDARGLYTTCQQNDISMCGLRPAVAVMEALGSERKIEIAGYDTSARVTGDAERVVGYAGAIWR